MSGVVRGWLSLPSPWEVGCGGESGRNELFAGTVCTLWSAHRSAKLEKTSLSTGGLPCPSEIDSAYFPGQFSPGTEHSSGGFRHRTWSVPALIVSNLKWGGPCRDHYVFLANWKSNFPQLYKMALKAYRISRSRKLLVAATRSALHLTRETFSGRRRWTGPIHLAESFVPANT